MEKMQGKKNHDLKWFLSWLISGGGTLVTVFTWEMLEESLENLIAFGISSLTAGLLLVSTTQVIKIGFKKLVKIIFPLVKTIFYREGDDKMKALKKYWTIVWGNKIAGTLAGAGLSATSYFVLQPFVSKVWLLALAVFGVFVVAYNIAVFFGGETVAQIEARLADARLNKQQKAKVKAIKNKVKELANNIASTQNEQLFAQAKQIVENEEAKKAEQK